MVSCCTSHWGKALGRCGSDQPLDIVTTPTALPLLDRIGNRTSRLQSCEPRPLPSNHPASLPVLCTASNAHQGTASIPSRLGGVEFEWLNALDELVPRSVYILIKGLTVWLPEHRNIRYGVHEYAFRPNRRRTAKRPQQFLIRLFLCIGGAMRRRQMRQAMGCRDDVPLREKGRRAEWSSPSSRLSREGVGEPALNDKPASVRAHGNDGTCRRLSVKRGCMSLLHVSSCRRSPECFQCLASATGV
jgi:hypothetical protein